MASLAPPAEGFSNPPRVTNRGVLAIAVPMTLAYLTTPMIGVVDTAVVGQFGDPAMLGGLAAGAIIFDLVFATFNFLRSGTTGLVAQAFGAGRATEEQAIFWRAAILALAIGTALAMLGPLVATLGGWFIGAEPTVTKGLRTYVVIRLVCAPFALLNYAILGYVLGRGKAGLGLALQILLNGANVLLSVWFGLWLGHGVAGVAWGTVTAEILACAVGTAIVLGRFRSLPSLGLRAVLDGPAFRAMIAINRDIMIRSFVLIGAFALMARQGAQLGTVTLAANAVLVNFFLVSGYFLDGFATAAEQLVGRSIGARDRRGFHDAVRLTTIWGFALALVAAVTVLTAGRPLIDLITAAPDVREAASTYLPWAALTAVSGVLAFQMDGVYIGATWSRTMRNMMLLSFAAYAAALLLLEPVLGNHGLWGALHVFLLVRGLSLAAMVPARLRETLPA